MVTPSFNPFAGLVEQVVANPVRERRVADDPTLQTAVLCVLRTYPSITAARLSELMDMEHERVRNALYRLLLHGRVQVVDRVRAPQGSAYRCVWSPTKSREGTQ